MGLIRAHIPLPDRAQLRSMLKAAMRQLNRAGVTSCQTDDFCTFSGLDWRDVVAAFRELETAGEMTVRVYEQCHFTTPEGIRQFIADGFSTGVGSNLFKIGPVKLMADGSLGARTARLRDGYADAPGEKGLLIYPQPQLEEMIAAAHQGGMQVAVHCDWGRGIGPGAGRMGKGICRLSAGKPPQRRCSISRSPARSSWSG